MTKEEFDRLYTDEKIAVYCPTQDLVDEFFELVDKFNYRYSKKEATSREKNLAYVYNKTFNSFDRMVANLYDKTISGVVFKEFESLRENKAENLRDLLKVGRVAELRNGIVGIVLQNKMMTKDGWVNLSSDWYSADLKSKRGNKRRGWDVVKIYDCPTINDSTWSFGNDNKGLLSLVWERKEFNVSEDEKSVLKLLPKKYKYIARDRSSEVHLYELTPQKIGNEWVSPYDIVSLDVYSHLFEYIKWEDEKPVKISDLLNS